MLRDQEADQTASDCVVACKGVHRAEGVGSVMIIYRDGRASDVPYILGTWRTCLTEGADGKGAVAGDVFRQGITDRIVRLLERSSVRIACDDKSDSTIVGFAVFDGSIGHFRYVRGGKNGFRGHGIASKLTEGHNITICTHRSQGHAPGRMRQTYNPFLLEK